MTDSEKLVLRLSMLFSPAKELLIDYICSGIHPPLQTSLKIIMQKLKGVVLEGDDSIGYQVPFVYKKVANELLTEQEKEKINNQISSFLLTPKNGILNAQDAIDGIYYAIFARNFKGALIHIPMMFLRLREEVDDKKLEWLLHKLRIIPLLSINTDNETIILHQLAMFSIGAGYARIRQYDNSIELLSSILRNKVKTSDGCVQGVPYKLLYSIASVYNILSFAAKKDIVNAFKKLDEYSVEYISDALDEYNLIEIVENLVLHTSKQDLVNLPKKIIISEIQRYNQKPINVDLFDHLAQTFFALGIVMAKEELSDIVSEFLNSDVEGIEPTWSLLKKICSAEYNLEKGFLDESLALTKEVLLKAKQANIISKELLILMLDIQASIFSKKGNKKIAAQRNRSIIKLFSVDSKSGVYALCNYRLAIDTENISEAIECLGKSSEVFQYNGMLNFWARSEGTMAIALYKKNCKIEALEIFTKLARNYYINKQIELGVATAIGIALTNRMVAELKNEELPKDNHKGLMWPEFDIDVFDKSAKEGKPNAEICTAFFILSEAYELLNDEKKQIECLDIAFSEENLNNTEVSGHYLVSIKLLTNAVKNGKYESIKIYLFKLFRDTERLSEIRKGISHDNGLCSLFFNILPNCIKDPIKEKHYIISIIDDIREIVSDVSFNSKRRSYWLAEINLKQAELSALQNDRDNARNYYIEAYNYAKEGSNYFTLLNAIQQLAFEYSSTLTELVYYQNSCLKHLNESMFNQYGQNLLKFWSHVNCLRITTKEAVYINELRDRAKRLVNENTIISPPIMVLALLDVSNSLQDPEYNVAKNWAKKQIICYPGTLQEIDNKYRNS